MDNKRIAQLSREEKLRLLDLVEEKKRRLRDSRDVYAPNEGQRLVHECEKRIRVVFSGNGSGKTALSVNEVIWAVQGYNPSTEKLTKVPCKVVVVLDRPEKVDEVWLPEIKKWVNIKAEQLHKDGRHYYSRITFDNGSVIRFMFSMMDPMAFESLEAHLFVFDEPPPRPIFISLMRGGRTKGRKARFLLVGTPISGSWLREDIYEPWVRGELPDTECFRYGTVVNEKNLADGYIDDFSRHLSEKERRIRLEGEFFDLEGLALAHLFKRRTHVISQQALPEMGPCVVAIDPHPNKQHVAILLGIDEHNYLYAIDEYGSKELPRQFAKSIKALWWNKYRLYDVVIDSLGSTEMTGGEGHKSFIQVVNEEGLRGRPTRYEDKKDESWIVRIQNALGMPTEPNNFGLILPKLRVSDKCVNLINDIETVSWVRFKNIDELKPKLDITSKDYLACLKYALACNLEFHKTKAKVFKRVKPITSYGQRRYNN